jgi:transposase
MKTRILSENERGMIVGMHIVGISTHRIAVELGMTLSTVFIVWKNFQERGTIQLLSQAVGTGGRPPNLNVRDKKVLGRILPKNRHLPLAMIREKMHMKVSPTTLRKAMTSIGFSNQVDA